MKGGLSRGLSRARVWLLAALVILLPLGGIAIAASLPGQSIIWYAMGGGGAIAEGGGYTLHGTANMAGASVGSSAGGGKSLHAGYAPAPGVSGAPPTAVPTPPGDTNGVFLPVVTR